MNQEEVLPLVGIGNREVVGEWRTLHVRGCCCHVGRPLVSLSFHMGGGGVADD